MERSIELNESDVRDGRVEMNPNYQSVSFSTANEPQAPNPYQSLTRPIGDMRQRTYALSDLPQVIATAAVVH